MSTADEVSPSNSSNSTRASSRWCQPIRNGAQASVLRAPHRRLQSDRGLLRNRRPVQVAEIVAPGRNSHRFPINDRSVDDVVDSAGAVANNVPQSAKGPLRERRRSSPGEWLNNEQSCPNRAYLFGPKPASRKAAYLPSRGRSICAVLIHTRAPPIKPKAAHTDGCLSAKRSPDSRFSKIRTRP